MNYLMVLGREPKISLAELEALFSSSKVKQVAPNLAIVTAHAVSAVGLILLKSPDVPRIQLPVQSRWKAAR